MSSYKGRHRRRRQLISGGAAALAIAGGAVAAVAIPGTASAAGLSAVYAKTTDWGTGYSAQYKVSNSTGQPMSDWNLTFTLPEGTKITSLWNASYTVDGQQVTVTPPAWQSSLDEGQTLDVGFVVSGASSDPTSCSINGADCSTTPAPAPTTSVRRSPPPRRARPRPRHHRRRPLAAASRRPPRASRSNMPPAGSPRTSTLPCSRRSTWSRPRIPAGSRISPSRSCSPAVAAPRNGAVSAI